jgi:hypothetical protein
MVYHSNSIFAGVWCAIVGIPVLLNLSYAAKMLHNYRKQAEYRITSTTAPVTKPGGGQRTKFPLLLRAMFLGTAIFSTTCTMVCIYIPWLYVDDGIRIDPFAQTSVQMYTLASQFCTTGMKLGTSSYVMSKLFSYMFFFIKQRTVRPMSHPIWQEKIIFLMTLGILAFSCLCAIVAEGDVNRLDQTCQLYMPIWILGTMAGADVTISFGYLYLFIQPLRETIRNNQRARKTVDSHAVISPTTATMTITVGERTTPNEKPSDAPAVNNALEEVMRKNTYACILTVVVSVISMTFMIVSHTVNDAYSRKWAVPVGQLDILITSLAITHIMHKPVKPAGRQALPMSPTEADRIKSSTRSSGKHSSNRGGPTAAATAKVQPVNGPAGGGGSPKLKHQQRIQSPTTDSRATVMPLEKQSHSLSPSQGHGPLPTHASSSSSSGASAPWIGRSMVPPVKHHSSSAAAPAVQSGSPQSSTQPPGGSSAHRSGAPSPTPPTATQGGLQLTMNNASQNHSSPPSPTLGFVGHAPTASSSSLPTAYSPLHVVPMRHSPKLSSRATATQTREDVLEMGPIPSAHATVAGIVGRASPKLRGVGAVSPELEPVVEARPPGMTDEGE